MRILEKTNVSKKAKIIIIIFFAMASTLFCGSDEEKINLTEEISKKATKMYAPPMVKTLFAKVKEAGYKDSVQFCSEYALEHTAQSIAQIEENMKKEYKISSIKIGRTSLKLRNPQNMATEKQKEILKEWEIAQKNKQELKPVYFKEGDFYFGMAPIVINSPVCLGCHGGGEARDKEAYEKIKSIYSDDKAVDYNLNDIRGAIVVKIAY
ncbi:MAG: DUF3365 domain-containing protein [Spirochaetia bacterium]|nr:DUF3365 domain-containing protein [Spirochaetia bacterium]